MRSQHLLRNKLVLSKTVVFYSLNGQGDAAKFNIRMHFDTFRILACGALLTLFGGGVWSSTKASRWEGIRPSRDSCVYPCMHACICAFRACMRAYSFPCMHACTMCVCMHMCFSVHVCMRIVFHACTHAPCMYACIRAFPCTYACVLFSMHVRMQMCFCPVCMRAYVLFHAGAFQYFLNKINFAHPW